MTDREKLEALMMRFEDWVIALYREASTKPSSKLHARENHERGMDTIAKRFALLNALEAMDMEDERDGE